jgi:hypothetical protein
MAALLGGLETIIEEWAVAYALCGHAERDLFLPNLHKRAILTPRVPGIRGMSVCPRYGQPGLRTQREEQMRRFFLLSVPVLAIAACAPQQPPPPPAAAAASPSETTTYFDGTYVGSFTENMSASGSGCPNFPVAPALTIQNGVARFAALNLTYQGYVTPQGDVRMQTPAGQTFVGHIDPHYVLTGQTTGSCVYNATWQRKEGRGPYTGG